MHSVIRIFVEGKINAQTPIEMLAKLGYNDLDKSFVESLKILRDDYGIELVSVPTLQDTVIKIIEFESNRIKKLSQEIQNYLPNKQKKFSREQIKHFNRLQNTRFKIVNQRHR